MRTFNVTGPCDLTLHYMVPAAQRLPEARPLIDEGLYFVVHAPRQTGKTTTLRALASDLNKEGGRVVVVASCETASVAGDDYSAAELLVLHAIREGADLWDYSDDWLPPAIWPDAPPGARLVSGLRAWARTCPVPIVLMLDEIDSLVGASLTSVLRQLRDGFQGRPRHFPASVVLCGMRDIRDYKAASGGDPTRLGTSSPFNVSVQSIRIGDFDHAEITALYAQHTADTGQAFADDAVDRVMAYTQGQPWLVNALAREVVRHMRVDGTVTAHHVDEAKERLIAARATHLDSLVAKLQDPRVQRIIEPILAGTQPGGEETFDDDLTYTRDLGLVTSRPMAVANPIYREIITRVLAGRAIQTANAEPRGFLLPDGRIDMAKLLREFVEFWHRHGEVLANDKGYHEAGAQLVLMGYLYRVVNGGGIVDSEYGVGRRRIDVLIRKPHPGPGGRLTTQYEVLELKVRSPGQADPLPEALPQIDEYLTRFPSAAGTVIIFDRRSEPDVAHRAGTVTVETTPTGRSVTLLRI